MDGPANFLLHLLEPLQFVLWGVALVAVALARERPRVALAVVALMTLAPLTARRSSRCSPTRTSQIGARPHRPRVLAERPLDRRAGARALGGAGRAARACAARSRALGGAFALVVGCALLILAWHMPSDVLGGYLVAGLWAALAVAALRAAERRWPLASP